MAAALVLTAVVAASIAAVLGRYAGKRAACRAADARIELLVQVIADALAGAGDRAASDAAVRRLGAVLGADAAAIGVVQGDVLALFGMHGYTSVGVNPALRRGEGCSGLAWQRGEPIIVTDVRRSGSYLEGANGIRSGIYVPGRIDGRLTLVVAVESRKRAAYDEDTLRLLQPIADLLACTLESRRLARAAEQFEQRLLALVGHEMRAPLTVILGALGTTLAHHERLDPVTRHDLLSSGVRAGRRLERLVEELLMAARLDADDVTFVRAPVRVEQVVAEAIDGIDTANRLRLDVPPDLAVVADGSHLTTVLHHLIENAVVHGRGPVEVRARPTGGGAVDIAIRDDGPGIPEAARGSELQFRASISRANGGAGLGLYLSRRLLDGMGGELRMDSPAARGCVVTARLPESVALPLPRLALDAAAGDQEQQVGVPGITGVEPH